MAIKKGKKLMLFVKEGTGESATYKSIAFATNHTFSSSASTIDISTKDSADAAEGAGKWDDQTVDTFSWSIISEHLYGTDPQGHSLKEVFQKYVAGTVLEVKFGFADNNTAGVTTGGWTPSTNSDIVLSGSAVITSFDFNAPNGDNVSASITLTGKGPVTVA